jgi:hypothetical protein
MTFCSFCQAEDDGDTGWRWTWGADGVCLAFCSFRCGKRHAKRCRKKRRA